MSIKYFRGVGFGIKNRYFYSICYRVSTRLASLVLVASIDGGSVHHADISRSRTVTPHTISTESEPTNPSISQSSPPVIKLCSEEDTVLTIRVPLSDKQLGSYDSPVTTSRSSGSNQDVTYVSRAPKYGDMQQSTSSSTEPSLSLSLEEEAISVTRRRVRPLMRSKQIITEGKSKKLRQIRKINYVEVSKTILEKIRFYLLIYSLS